MRRNTTLLAITAALATAGALMYTTGLKAGEPTGGASSILCDADGNCTEALTVQCKPRAFAWGQPCWNRREGAAFTAWLRRHGSTPQRFRERFPELAAMFTQPWPPPRRELWETCVTGEACARAVIQHVFGGNWRYWFAIAGCETGYTYDARAVGSAGERGLLQIHPVHFGWLDESRLFEPLYNARAAYRLSSGGTDASPWACA